MEGGLLQRLSAELVSTPTQSVTVEEVPERDTSRAQHGQDMPERDTSRAQEPLANNALLASLQKGQENQLKMMANLMTHITVLKSDVDRLRKEKPPTNSTGSEASASRSQSPNLQSELDERSPSGLFTTIAAGLSLEETVGNPVSEDLAILTKKLLSASLDDKKRSELCEKYPIPENVGSLNAPKVNSEIWRVMEPKTRTKDIKLQKLQQHTLRATVPVLQVIDNLVSCRDQKDQIDVDLLVTKLVDVLVFSSACNADLNSNRRDIIRTNLNFEYQSICSNNNPVTTLLFGDNITEYLKSITESNRIGVKVGGGKFRHTPYTKERPQRKSEPFLGHRQYGGRRPPSGMGRRRGPPFHKGQPFATPKAKA